MIAVLDTETTWSDEVMSLGFVIADEDGFEEVCGDYYIVDPVYKRGGMYSYELIQPKVMPVNCSGRKIDKGETLCLQKKIGKLLER